MQELAKDRDRTPRRAGRAGAAIRLWAALVLLAAWLAVAPRAIGQSATSAPTPAPNQQAPDARAAVETPYWIENAELVAVRLPASGAAPIPRPAGGGTSAQPQGDPAGAGPTRAEVFDSADYQFLLLVGPTWQEALLVNLGTGDVRAYPGAEVVGSDGRPRRADPAAGRSIAGFTTHEDGRITFATADHDYAIEPAPPLVGEIPVAGLYARQPVYERRARGYTPDPGAIARLAGITRNVDVVAFFGTWCQICKKHLPALLSTIDHAGNPHLKLTLIAVSEDGTEPADWIEACEAGYATPTFIVRIDEIEIGRIEEEPRVSVETDLVDILAQMDGR